MKLYFMAALYFWGNLFLMKADKIFYEAANANRSPMFVSGDRTKRINRAIEAHMRLENFLKLR